TLFNNIIAFAGTGIKMSNCTGGCSIIGGLITGNARQVDLVNSIAELADLDITNGGGTTEGARVDGTSIGNFSRVLLTASGTGTGINVLAGGKARADMLDYIVPSGTPTEISN